VGHAFRRVFPRLSHATQWRMKPPSVDCPSPHHAWARSRRRCHPTRKQSQDRCPLWTGARQQSAIPTKLGWLSLVVASLAEQHQMWKWRVYTNQLLFHYDGGNGEGASWVLVGLLDGWRAATLPEVNSSWSLRCACKQAWRSLLSPSTLSPWLLSANLSWATFILLISSLISLSPPSFTPPPPLLNCLHLCLIIFLDHLNFFRTLPDGYKYNSSSQ